LRRLDGLSAPSKKGSRVGSSEKAERIWVQKLGYGLLSMTAELVRVLFAFVVFTIALIQLLASLGRR
jgi:hypothetical protein